jgi:hypothetical protein
LSETLDAFGMVKWALDEPVSSTAERTVLLVIATLLAGEVTGRLSQSTVAEAASMSVRAVRAAMSRLARGGTLEVQQRGRGAPMVTLIVVQGGEICRAAKSAGLQNLPGGNVQGGEICRAGQGGNESSTVSPEYIPPYSPPTAVETAGEEDGDDGLAQRAPDHFAQRREHQRPDLDPMRWQAIEGAISSRTLDRRGRFMGEGLTAAERSRVLGWVAQHGIDTVERLIASMPDRVGKPTAYLAKCIERHVEAQQQAQRERARVRRDGLYVPKPALRPEEISDFDVLGALGLKDEAS